MNGETSTMRQLGEAFSVRRVFGEPIERDGALVVPVAQVRGGWGGGGPGMVAGPDLAAAGPEDAGLAEAGPAVVAESEAALTSEPAGGGQAAGAAAGPAGARAGRGRWVERGTVRGPGEAGGMGAFLSAKPAGVYVIKNGEVSWLPATDPDKAVVWGCFVAVVFLLVGRSVLRAFAARPAS